MNTIYLITAVVTISALTPSLVHAHEKSLGIIGDSVATGAVAGDVVATYTDLAWNGIKNGLTSPIRTSGGVNFFANSFATVLSTGFGVEPKNIHNMAVNGNRVGTIGAQTEALLKEAGTLPDYIVISYTANNACHPDIFKQSPEDFYQRYYDSLIGGKDGKAGLRSLVQRSAGDKTRYIYLMASLDFTEVLTNKSILDHLVPLHKSIVQCRAFRFGAKDLPKDHDLAVRLRGMCPAVLNTDPDGTEPEHVFRRKHLKDIHTAMIAAQRRVVAQLKSEAAANVKIEFVAAPIKLKFDSRHIANDCFHLSNQGQGYLGLGIWDEIYTGLIH